MGLDRMNWRSVIESRGLGSLGLVLFLVLTVCRPLPIQRAVAQDVVSSDAEAKKQRDAITADREEATTPIGPKRGVLMSINGDLFEGAISPDAPTGTIGWQGIHFDDAFRFRLGAVRSVKFPAKSNRVEPTAPFSFELTTGDVIRGDLIGLSEQSVQVFSDAIGRVSFRRELLRLVHRIDENSMVAFSALRGMDGWRTLTAEGGWLEDGDEIETTVPGAGICGDLEVPPRAVVDVELSWRGKPDFVFAIGVDPEAEGDSGQDGWRLETAADQLAIVRERAERADIDTVADLAKLSRLRLIVYLDQIRGTMEVLDVAGKSQGKISLANAETPVSEPVTSGATASGNDAIGGRGIRILNRGESLRLEKLHVARWVGGIPNRDASGRASIALSDGRLVSGSVIRLNSTTGRLEMVGDPEKSTIAFDDVVAIRFSPAVAYTDPGQCALFLSGGMRLSGRLLGVDQKHWILGGENYLDQVRLPHAAIRSFVVFQSDAANVETKPVLGRIGRLEVNSDRSSGRLITDPKGGNSEAFPLGWHPLNSETSARLRRNLIGKLVYRDPPKIDKQSASARMLAQQKLRFQQQRRGLNFGELFLRRADLTKESVVKRDAHILHLRSGDVIACRVDGINDRGVLLSTLRSDEGFVPNEKLKAIEFVANSPPPNILAAKRERLLTIPRMQKTAPPTHLLCSHNGDFLRCRLLGTKDGMLQIEIQSEKMLVPRARVAQIIWFHDDEIEKTEPTLGESMAVAAAPGANVNMELEQNGPVMSEGYVGLVQIVLNDGKRVTFRPEGLRDGSIEGTSPWVGECRFDLNSVDQILLGDQIESEVADVAYNQWRLQPAVEPLVTAVMQGENNRLSGTQSPLVGNDAPAIKLDLLEGDRFELSTCRGQIVVLDFWASWCGPCMETMPMLTEAMSEFDPREVRWISVNLQESPEQIREVLRREKIRTTVALDVDGVAAQRYQATALPQLVIVGTDGKVKRLYVGGGQALVQRVQQDLRELTASPETGSP